MACGVLAVDPVEGGARGAQMASEPRADVVGSREPQSDALAQRLRELRQITSEAQQLASDLAAEVEEYKRQVLVRCLGRRDDAPRTRERLPIFEHLSDTSRRLEALADRLKRDARALGRDLEQQLAATARDVAVLAAAEAGDLRALLDEYERQLIVSALEACGRRQNAAARMLGILPTTLNEKLKRLGLRPRPPTRSASE
jgi:DNA-binding protein Fis